MLDVNSNVAVSYAEFFESMLMNLSEDEVADLVIQVMVPAMDPEALERVIEACYEERAPYYDGNDPLCSCEQDGCTYCDCDCHEGQAEPMMSLDEVHACTYTNIAVADMIMRIRDNMVGWKTEQSGEIVTLCDEKLMDILENIE